MTEQEQTPLPEDDLWALSEEQKRRHTLKAKALENQVQELRELKEYWGAPTQPRPFWFDSIATPPPQRPPYSQLSVLDQERIKKRVFHLAILDECQWVVRINLV